MKKLAAVSLLVALVTMLLGGCGSEPATYTETETAITVNTGEQFVIALEGNATTGYTWNEDFDDRALELVDSEYQENEHAEGIVGVGGTHNFTFKALQAGTTTVTMRYARIWESDSTAGDKVIEYTVTIK